MDRIQAEANELFDTLREFRRDFHRYPELGFEEFRTSKIVATELNGLGLEVQIGVGKTGVTTLIEGSLPGRTILLRFDMDALPIQEETGFEYRSQNLGKMHACGHDAHTTIGLGVARLLVKHQAELHGKVKLVFQPAEECLGGATGMIEAGVLETPRPDVVYSMHVWNDHPLGWLAVVPGPLMAASDIFHIAIHGKGGHGAVPDQAIDPIVAAAQVITGLQTLVSRNVSPLQAAVVSVTKIKGGETYNVIPATVELSGTIRFFDEGVHQIILQRFRQIVEGIASAMGCQAEIKIDPLTPAVVNEPQITLGLQKLIAEHFPQFKIETAYQTMGSEDMSFMMQRVPGCYILIGSSTPGGGIAYPQHHPKFNLDEGVLTEAVSLLTTLALAG